MTPAASIVPVITRPAADETAVIERPRFSLGVPELSSTAAGVEAVAVAMQATLVVLDDDRFEVSALPVLFRRRVKVGDTATLLGTDPSGAIRVMATVTTSPPTLKLHLNYAEGDSALPRALLPAFRFLRAAHQPNRLAMRLGDRLVGEVDELPSEEGFPQHFIELVRSLAFVQTMTGSEFSLPPEFDHEDRRTLREAEALLLGEAITSKWADATLGLSTIDTDLLAVVDGDGLFRLEFVAPVVARIAGHDLSLGEAQYVFRMAQFDNYDELRRKADAGDVAGAQARLRPGADNAYEVTLLSPPLLGLNDHDLRAPVTVSAADLRSARRKALRRDAFKPAS